MPQFQIPFKTFKGISESEYQGIEGSFYRSVGTDIHSKPGIIQANQKATQDDSGVTWAGLPKYAFVGSDGNQYWFDDGGKIMKRASNGTWSQVGAEGAEIFGAAEHNGNFYWAIAASLKYIATNTASTTWQTDGTSANFPNGTTPHPMWVHLTDLYIGDGKDVVKGSDATTSVLDLHPDHDIQSITSFGVDLVIGAKVSNVNKCGIFRWKSNLAASSWENEDYINEDSLTAMLKENQTNEIIISAGTRGNLYRYNGAVLQKVRNVQGTYTPSAKMQVHPHSMANFGDLMLIGVSNSTGNPCLEGVYSYKPTIISGVPYAILNLDFIVSNGSQPNTSGVEIGAILVDGQDIYFGWKDGATYGVDKVDWSNKYGSAYLETMYMFGKSRTRVKQFKEWQYAMNALPASTSLTLKYQKDEETSYTALNDSPINATDTTLKTLYQMIEGDKIQNKIDFGVNANDSPQLEYFNINYDLSDKVR